MLNTFITASINNTVIYIKIGNGILHELFDVLYDFGYTIKKSTPNEWEYHLYYGSSYEMNNELELEEFKENNETVKDLRNETQS